jgi:hypothetical protein
VGTRVEHGMTQFCMSLATSWALVFGDIPADSVALSPYIVSCFVEKPLCDTAAQAANAAFQVDGYGAVRRASCQEQLPTQSFTTTTHPLGTMPTTSLIGDGRTSITNAPMPRCPDGYEPVLNAAAHPMCAANLIEPGP